MDNKLREELRSQLFNQLEQDERELAYLVSEYGSIIDRYLFLQEEIESVPGISKALAEVIFDTLQNG